MRPLGRWESGASRGPVALPAFLQRIHPVPIVILLTLVLYASPRMVWSTHTLYLAVTAPRAINREFVL